MLFLLWVRGCVEKSRWSLDFEPQIIQISHKQSVVCFLIRYWAHTKFTHISHSIIGIGNRPLFHSLFYFILFLCAPQWLVLLLCAVLFERMLVTAAVHQCAIVRHILWFLLIFYSIRCSAHIYFDEIVELPWFEAKIALDSPQHKMTDNIHNDRSINIWYSVRSSKLMSQICFLFWLLLSVSLKEIISL